MICGCHGVTALQPMGDIVPLGCRDVKFENFGNLAIQKFENFGELWQKNFEKKKNLVFLHQNLINNGC